MNMNSTKKIEELTDAFFSKHIEKHCDLHKYTQFVNQPVNTFFVKRKSNGMVQSDFDIDWNDFDGIRQKLSVSSQGIFTDLMLRDLMLLHQNIAPLVKIDGSVSENIYVMF